MLAWLAAEPAGIVVADMGFSARLRRQARHGVVCHPHYESAQLRDRCFWSEKLYGHRTVREEKT